MYSLVMSPLPRTFLQMQFSSYASYFNFLWLYCIAQAQNFDKPAKNYYETLGITLCHAWENFEGGNCDELSLMKQNLANLLANHQLLYCTYKKKIDILCTIH